MARKSRKHLEEQPISVVTCMKLWRVALYIRLSVEDKGDHGDSLETQRKIMEAFLALRPELKQVEVYTDNGSTGRNFDRPAFGRMMEDIEAGKIDCIIVKDLSRLGRNVIDTGYYIEKYFPTKGVRFIAVNDQFDSEDDDNSCNRVTLPLKNMINEAYAFDISRKVRTQAKESMKAGEFIGARPPYGYLKAVDNCHKLVIDNETAPIVREIFQWAADGIPLNEMVTRLNERGIITPGTYAVEKGWIADDSKLAGSGLWQTRTITKILNGEVYIGHMVQGKKTTVGQTQLNVNPEDWITVKNTHEPLISEELFLQAKEMRLQRSTKWKDANKKPYSENVLRGKIFCEHCGKNMHRQRSHEKYFFHCISNDRIAKDFCAGNPRLFETDLFQMILSIIQEEATVIIGKRMDIKRSDAKVEAKRKAMTDQLSTLRKRTTEKQKFLKGLYENFVLGVLSPDEYTDMKAGYEAEIADFVAQTQALEDNFKALDAELEHLFSLADKLKQIKKKPNLTAALVSELVERITVSDKDTIDVAFRFQNAFGQIAEVLGDE